ncbi:MAG: DUF167 domain-containing protein [Chloroflexota bacterium]|nr:DUF167 domain-containing protein [Chloroflexota bacterium]
MAIQVRGGRVTFDVRVVPRAARTAVGGSRDGALLVRVTAAPVDDAANEAVVAALARALGVAPRDVVIERGGHGRRKVLSVPADTVTRLEALART